jgi:hypothetical protein
MKATAKHIRMLDILAQELAIAQGAWNGRTAKQDSDPVRRHALKREATMARIRHRRMFACFEVQGGWPHGLHATAR